MDVENKGSESSKSARLPTLDVLRGVAAFIVVIGHLFLMYPEADRMQIPTWLRISVLRILVNGHASVILFFILSGYVLSLPYLKGKPPLYSAYLIKRLFRIYIPFSISILIAAALYTWSTPAATDIGSDWFHREWSDTSLTLENIINHLVMTGISDQMWLNGVMWSLVVELRISIIFPFIIYLCNFNRLALIAGISIYLITATIIVIYDMPMQTAESFAGTFIITLRFVPFFMAGILLAKHHEKIKARLNHITKLQFFLLILFILSIFCMPAEIYNQKNISYLSTIISPETLNNALKFSADFLIGLASSLLIVLVRHYGENMKLFTCTAMTWLGRVSYSLYLIHLPLVFVTFRLLLGHLSFFWICLIAIAVSLTAAAIFFALIEKPAMQAGKYLSKRVERK